MDDKKSHFIFDGSKMLVSQDLIPVINFLAEIEKEVEVILNFDKKLESFFCPVRSQAIVVFANLEVLLRLNFAYDSKISDGDEIRKRSLGEKVWQEFYCNFCLSIENEWVKSNQGKFHITVYDLRYLRNSLTHFFSVDKRLGLSYATSGEQSIRLEKMLNYKIKLVSPEDLYEIVKSAAKLMIKKWSKDCEDSFSKNSSEFKERISCINELVKSSGALIVKSENLNL